MKLIAWFAACLIWLAAACWTPAAAQADSGGHYIGEVIAIGTDFCPDGWAEMNGQLLPISENDALFQLIGTTYGGDGQSTFALPAAKPIISATGATLLPCIALFGIFPSQN
jgi:microcystin-dependent protein